MPSLLLEYPREDAKTIVKAAFENTRGIEQYHDDGHRVVGKSGLGLVSWGEQVIVEVPEAQASDEETTISVRAEREVSTNVTANPEKYRSRFLEQVEALRDRNVDPSLDDMSENPTSEASKEVESSGDLRSGTTALIVFVAFTTLLSVLLMLFVWSL